MLARSGGRLASRPPGGDPPTLLPHPCPALPYSSRSFPHVGQLRLYDVANTAGVAADLSHINTAAAVSAHTGPEQLGAALEGAHLVVIPAGVPRKPGMTRDDLFNINAGGRRAALACVCAHVHACARVLHRKGGRGQGCARVAQGACNRAAPAARVLKKQPRCKTRA